MGRSSVFCGIAVLASLVFAAWLLVNFVPVLKREVQAERHSRSFYPQLEGLRGLLAACIFLLHAVIRFIVLPRTSEWIHPSSHFYAQLGIAPVLMFFFLTGFLFWSKLLRKPKLELGSYFAARFRRLCPAYALAMLWLFLLVAIVTGFTRATSIGSLVNGALQWICFTVPGEPDLNGLRNTWLLIAGTPWTLRYEWGFYILLPFLTWFAKAHHRTILLVLLFGALFAGTLPQLQQHLTASNSGWNAALPWIHRVFGHLCLSFGVGMIVATVHSRWASNRWLAKSHVATVGCVICAAVVLLWVKTEFNEWVMSGLLGIVFLCLVYGNTIWGLLDSAPMLLLGKCSYSLYLCHGLLLSTMIFLVGSSVHLAQASTVQVWLLIEISALLVLVTSVTSYQLVEKPFLAPNFSSRPKRSVNDEKRLSPSLVGD